MQSKAFIADMNALMAELDSLPPAVRVALVTLMELVDVQNDSIEALLATNKKLLAVIEELRG